MRSPGPSASPSRLRNPANTASSSPVGGRTVSSICVSCGSTRPSGSMNISHRLWPPKPSGSMRWRQTRSSSAWVRTVGR